MHRTGDGPRFVTARELVTVRAKVRCPHCGAKNGQVEMCRICGMLMPDAAAVRRRGTGDGTPSFDETVEREEAEWREYSGQSLGPYGDKVS